MTKDIKHLLKSHLIRQGFRFFDSVEEYHNWSSGIIEANKIPDKAINKIEKLEERAKKEPTYKNQQEWLNFVSGNRHFTKVILSMQSDPILNSGLAVLEEICDGNKLLDIGCSAGYLASFYAMKNKQSSVIGYDILEKLILRATRAYSNLTNLSFVNSIENLTPESIDVITDTQCLAYIKDKEVLTRLLISLKGLLSSNGRIISISALPSAIDADMFLQIIRDRGLFISKIKPIYFYMFGEPYCFLKILIHKSNSAEEKFDVKEYYEEILKHLEHMRASVR